MIPTNRLLSFPWQVCLAYYNGVAGDNPKYTFKKNELRLQNSSKSFTLKGFTDAIAMQKTAPTVVYHTINAVSVVQVLISKLKFSYQTGGPSDLDQTNNFDLGTASYLFEDVVK